MEEFVSAKRSRSAHLAQLTKTYNELERQMLFEDNSEGVKQLYKNLCDRFQVFKDAHFLCLESYDDPSIVELLETNFLSQKRNFEEFRERYTEWERQLITDPDDNASIISGASSTRSSRAKLLSAKNKETYCRKPA